jgi:peptidyl-prolyl cis-trans isomerase C
MIHPLPRAMAFAFVLGLAAPISGQAAEDAKTQPADPVVAIVDGLAINLSELEEGRSRLPQQARTMPLAAIFAPLLGAIIDTKLVAAAARKEGMLEDAELKRVMARVEEQILERALLSSLIEKGVTDEVLKTRYERLVADTSNEEEVSARHILLAKEEDAKAVIEELAKGTDFAELAKKKSEGPSKDQGGDLGFFKESAMVPEFAKAAFSMKKGEVTQTPVKTQFGWHVIKVEDRRTAQPPAYAAAEGKLRQDLAREIAESYRQDLRDKAKIERFNADGSPVAEKAKK